jgi:type II secretory pathway pseudopilin PulG
MIETLVAITVIVMATVSALSMMRTAISGNQIIEDKVIAMNLAMEGIDAVRNIRDTNYLRFYSDADECWDKINAPVGSDCTSKTSISNGDYYLIRNIYDAPLFEWVLRPVTLDIHGNLDLYEFTFDSDGDGIRDSEANLYAQTVVPAPAGFTSVERAKFRRILTVDLASDTTFQVTSTVTWETGGIEKNISLTGVIANVY